MYNEKQAEYFKDQAQSRAKKREEKSKEVKTYQEFIESPVYKEVKAQMLELALQEIVYDQTQEGLMKLHGETQFNKGIFEFFKRVERKAKG